MMFMFLGLLIRDIGYIMELNILNAPDGGALPPQRYSIPLWRIVVSISLLIIVLLASTVVVCGTNEICRARIPTLSNLLNSTFVAPCLITSLNCLLSLQLFLSMSIFYKTRVKAPYWSRLQMLASTLVYVSVVITLFVFPFTDWSKNWANITIIVSLNVWMAVIIISLRRFYRHRIDSKQNMLFFSTCFCMLYALSSVSYIIIRVVSPEFEAWLLITEIFSAIAIGGFLVLCLGHVWNLEFSISVP